MLLSSLVAIVFSFAFASALDPSCKTYIVRQGDFCDAISQANNVSTHQLAYLNSQINARCNNLMIGETLCLSTSSVNCAKTYVVQLHDTCDGVAAAHHIHLDTLYQKNPQINRQCTNMYIGEVLCVSSEHGAHKSPGAPGHHGGHPIKSQGGNDYNNNNNDNNLPWCDE